MFRSLDLAQRRRPGPDSGFTLIEVVVAIGIMVLVTAALTPQIVVGLRAAGVSRDLTQIKGLAQAQLERMRNAPFHVGSAAGDYIDLLDTYYPNTEPPKDGPEDCDSVILPDLPSTSWTGFVSESDARCSWEPDEGAFYRYVINPIAAPGIGTFAMVVSTAFLSASTPPKILPPPHGYDSTDSVLDAPAASQVGVTIAVIHKTHSGYRHVATYSQIERSTPMDPLLESRSRTTTVAVSSATEDGTVLQQQLGNIHLRGELFAGSRVVVNVTAGRATTSKGDQAVAATMDLEAPEDDPSPPPSTSPSSGFLDGCDRMCFGKSVVDQASALAGDGLPRAGQPSLPVRVRLLKNTGGSEGFQFSNGDATDPSLDLQVNAPMVSVDTKAHDTLPVVKDCLPSTVNDSAYLSATGYLAASASLVDSCATAQTTVVRLFPTSNAAGGVIRIRLERASARCLVNRTSAVANQATAEYRATLWYPTSVDGDDVKDGYTSVQLSSDQSASPLTEALLETELPGGRRLSDYIASWKSGTTTDMVTKESARGAEATVPAAVTLLTHPTRTGDPTSAIALSIGSTSCRAEDQR